VAAATLAAGRNRAWVTGAADVSGPIARWVRRVTASAQLTYSNSWAASLWDRLRPVDIANQATLFAATLLLCFIPFLIVASALAGKPVANILARRVGLNEQAAAAMGHLFTSSAATTQAISGSASAVLFVLGGVAAATALQQLYTRVFEVERRRAWDLLLRFGWLAVLMAVAFLGGWAGPQLHRFGGPVLLGLAGLVFFTVFWWFTMWFLLGGRLSWRSLWAPAIVTGAFWLGMNAAFALFFSRLVITEDREYGPIGTVFALMTYLIAIGVVLVLGAVIGVMWRDRRTP
jgi:membrane protein